MRQILASALFLSLSLAAAPIANATANDTPAAESCPGWLKEPVTPHYQDSELDDGMPADPDGSGGYRERQGSDDAGVDRGPEDSGGGPAF